MLRHILPVSVCALMPVVGDPVSVTAEPQYARTAAAAEPLTTRSPVFTTDEYEIWLEQQGLARKNAPSKVAAVLVSKAPFKCNSEYPARFVPEATTNVSFSAEPATLRVEPARCTLDVSYVANAPGVVRLTGTFKFSVCTPERCLVRKHPLTLEVVVDP